MEGPEGRDIDYYAILNLARDCSQEEVTKAYRELARVFHPDKHQDQELKQGAQDAFGKLQESYEVLSDVHKRQIYDIYGKQGLAAGFEVGEWLHNVDDLKKEWEEFKKRRDAQKEETSTSIKGLYQCRIDATEPLRRGLGVRSIVVTNSIDAAVGESDHMHVQGQAAVRNQSGSGNIIFGYTRPLSQHDTLDGSLVLGLRSLLTLTSTRQIDPHTTGSTTVTWGPHDGLGLQLSSTRQMPYNCSGTFAWVLGPAGAPGMSLAVSRRGALTALQGKVEVGAATALSARATLMLTKTVNLRAIARLGSTGIDLEVGATKRFSPQTTGYLGTLVGLQGIIVKVRVSRSNQVVEFPVIMSPHWDDWRVLVAASVAPPLIYLVASRYVVRPLLTWRRKRAERLAAEEHAEAVEVGLRAAAKERALLTPVARRKARAEAGRGGLVVLEAAYGLIGKYREAQAAAVQLTQQATSAATAGTVGLPSEQAETAAAAAAAAAAGRSGAEGGGAAGEAASSGSRAAAAQAGSSFSSGAEAAPGSTAAAAAPAPEPGAEGLPVVQPWLLVNEALQYLVVDSRLVLHPGTSKVGLMGFADPAPGSGDQQLYVAYCQHGTVREVVVDDMAGLSLAATEAEAAQAGAAAGSRREGGGLVEHAVVEDAALRDWLLRRGAACWGLEMGTLLPASEAQPG